MLKESKLLRARLYMKVNLNDVAKSLSFVLPNCFVLVSIALQK